MAVQQSEDERTRVIRKLMTTTIMVNGKAVPVFRNEAEAIRFLERVEQKIQQKLLCDGISSD